MPADNLIGTWTCVSATVDGKPLPKETADLLSLTLTENRYKTEKGSQVLFDSSYTIDPSTNPRQINMVGTEGDMSGKEAQGIYSLEEDVLRICYVMPGLPRPKEFQSEVQKCSWFHGSERPLKTDLKRRSHISAATKRCSVLPSGRFGAHGWNCTSTVRVLSALSLRWTTWAEQMECWRNGVLSAGLAALQSEMVPREGFPPPTSPF